MKIRFVYDVDFVSLPLSPPTLPNCEKCAFYSAIKNDYCVRTSTRLCSCGKEGYFIRNSFKEEVVYE
jgi:hypothetical protein